MNGRAIAGRLHFDLERALFLEIDRVRGGDHVSPVNVLVGSHVLGLYLGRRFAEHSGGHCNVRFLTFIDLVSLLERSPCRRLLPPLSEEAILEEILSCGELPPYFHRVRRMRGFRDALAASFTDLAEGCCTADTARELIGGASAAGAMGDRVRALLSLYVRFREAVERRGADVHVRFREAVAGAAARSLDAPLLAYGFYDFNEAQWRLIRAFAAGPGVTLFIPACRDEAYRFVGRTMKRLETCGFDIVHLPPSDGASKLTARKVLLSAPGEEEEVRGIVGRIVELVRGRGARFCDIGIVLPSMDAYWPLLREVLDESGIPYAARERLVSGVSPAAAGALRLARLLSGKLQRAEIVEFLLTAPLAVRGSGGDADPVSRWVRKSAEAGMVGDGGWPQENDRLIERLIRSVQQDAERTESVEAARIVGGILARITSARSSFETMKSWGDFARSSAALLRYLFRASEDTEFVCRLVQSLEKLDAVSETVSHTTFCRLCEEALGAVSMSGGWFSGGVNVLTLGQARGLSFRFVLIPGLIEGFYPRIARQDPFLKDDERSQIERITGGIVNLSQRMDRIDEEALLFRLALDSAREELVCSYPRFEQGTGKERMPSSFLAMLDGFSLGGAHDASIAFRRLSRRDPASGGREPVSEGEYDLFNVRAYGSGSGDLPESRFFAKGAALVQARWGERRFTPYDGVFSSRRALDEVRALLEERGWSFSPTSLEAYAACPFAYFLGHILCVESLEEPERIVTVTPLQRGSLVHAALAQLYRNLRERGLLPLDERTVERAYAVADEVVDAACSDYQEHEPVGIAVFWEMERRMVSESIRMLLEEEANEREGYVPLQFERPFGGPRDESRIAFGAGERTLAFHGRIDRIDTGTGDSFRVIDYKTGRLAGRDQDLAGGTSLQLPVYLLAASAILGRPISSGTALYRRIGVGEGKREVRFDGSGWMQAEKDFGDVAATITGGIEDGLFFAAPGSGACAYCRMRAACPAGRLRLFEIKAGGDERCRRYVAMRGLAGGED